MKEKFNANTRDVARELARRYSTMTHEELDALESILVPIKYPKGELVLKEGDVCRNFYYIDRGLMRQFYFKHGKEVTEHLAQDHTIVTAHYTGRTINGKKFDSSRGGAPIAFRLSDLIKGWIVAMQQMCVGDKWEVYIPANMGYGKFSQPGIPGGSTLIFEIELLGIA